MRRFGLSVWAPTMRNRRKASAPSGTSQATSAPPRATRYRPGSPGQGSWRSSEREAGVGEAAPALGHGVERAKARLRCRRAGPGRRSRERGYGPNRIGGSFPPSATVVQPAIRANGVPREQFPPLVPARISTPMRTTPPAQGLYDPRFEHDACGVAFVVDMHGRRSHSLVEQGITALVHLDHRGASGAETNTGDGAGILIQVPDAFYRGRRSASSFRQPATTPPASGSCRGDDAEVSGGHRGHRQDRGQRRPRGPRAGARFRSTPAAWARARWAPCPPSASSSSPDPVASYEGLDLERRVYVVRKRIEHEIGAGETARLLPEPVGAAPSSTRAC